jgi:hypothetical protein
MLMPHIIFMIKNLLKNMPHLTQKNPKIKTLIIHLEPMPWNGKNRCLVAIRVEEQQQRSLIITMKNFVHEIIYDEQIH